MEFYYINEKEGRVEEKIKWLLSKGYTSEHRAEGLCFYAGTNCIYYTDKYNHICVISNDFDLVVDAFAKELKWEDIKNDEIFKPKFRKGDLVLVRDCDDDCWIATRFYEFDESSDFCFEAYIFQENYHFKQCIPFEGNEHLIGTKDKPTEG